MEITRFLFEEKESNVDASVRESSLKLNFYQAKYWRKNIEEKYFQLYIPMMKCLSFFILFICEFHSKNIKWWLLYGPSSECVWNMKNHTQNIEFGHKLYGAHFSFKIFWIFTHKFQHKNGTSKKEFMHWEFKKKSKKCLEHIDHKRPQNAEILFSEKWAYRPWLKFVIEIVHNMFQMSFRIASMHYQLIIS